MGNGFGAAPTTINTAGWGLGSLIWIIITFIVAIAGCFVVYFLIVANKKFKSNNKFVNWLVDFLRFDKMLIEDILKIAYIFVAILVTLGSLVLIPKNVFSFLGMLVFGNIIIRVVYEAALIKIMIWKNTTEIKQKLK